MAPTSSYAAIAPISSGLERIPDPAALVGDPAVDPRAPGLWSVYWCDFGEGELRPARCHLPGGGMQIVDRHWIRFAADLPRGTQIVDLGCGAGTVGRTLIGSRPDLVVTGIDFADVPVVSSARLQIFPRVRMEALPFGDGRFGAAVSLFGIEYGAISPITLELQRVLTPGAPFCFVIHHCDGEIAREGRTRVAGIEDCLSAPVRTAFLAGNQAAFESERRRLVQQHPGEPTVQLICDYFRRQLLRSQAERHANWEQLSRDVAAELYLTSQMVRRAKSPGQLAAWLAPLLAAMEQVAVSVLRQPGGGPVGWCVSGRR